jgi:3-phosphoshikimate 1-carboxyvinyltransferase
MRPPGSKSITNRALVCAALADGTSTLAGALDSEDTQVMIDGLRQLGIEIQRRGPKPPASGDTLIIRGTRGRVPALEAELFCANSGTTMRFLTALVTLGHGPFRLDGVPRLRERPMGELLEALNQLGVNARSENDDGGPPIIVHANGLPGGAATIRGSISSQFLSGLLMAAPCAQRPVELHIEGPLVSQPYVWMTLAVMRAFGVDVETNDRLEYFRVAPQSYRGCHFEIEPDASAASYFWAAAAVTGGEATVEGLTASSLQGDVAFVDCLAQMGCDVRHDANSTTVVGRPLSGIDVDMNAISDTVQTLAVVALFAKGETTICNVAHIRHKETDRVAALAAELQKLGADVIERGDGLTIRPRQLQGATIDTYQDHRMAMSFAVAGLRIAGVRINNPSCVDKTYPRYFDDFSTLSRST